MNILLTLMTLAASAGGVEKCTHYQKTFYAITKNCGTAKRKNFEFEGLTPWEQELIRKKGRKGKVTLKKVTKRETGSQVCSHGKHGGGSV